VEVFHLARFARAFFFCAALCAINANQSHHENEKGEPVDEFAFVLARRLLPAVMQCGNARRNTRIAGRAKARRALTSTLPVRP
jgi:hypothetical protein